MSGGLPEGLCWPWERAGELLLVLGQQGGLAPVEVEPPRASADSADPPAQGRWLDAAAAAFGLEVEPVFISYAELVHALQSAGPAVLGLPDGSLVGLVGPGGGGRIRLLDASAQVRRLPIDLLRTALCAAREAPLIESVEATLATAGVAPSRRARARRLMLEQALGNRPVARAWLLRPSPRRSWKDHARLARLRGPLLTLIISHIAQVGLLLLGWWLLGGGLLQGRVDGGLLVAWGLVLLTTVPIRILSAQAGGEVALRWGALLKERLLVGALAMEPEEVRHQGVGSLLGRVVEGEAVEALAFNGGISALLALVELVLAAWVLSQGAGGLAMSALLVIWSGGVLALGVQHLRALGGWTAQRRTLTRDLVETMVGHRTRLAQQAPQHFHEGEDPAQARYLERSAWLDAAQVRLRTLAGRGWTVLGLGGLAAVLLVGTPDGGRMAVAVGGLVLGAQALTGLGRGLAAIAGAVVAWREVGPLFLAAERPIRPGLPELAAARRGAAEAGPLIEAEELRFTYPGRSRPVLDGLSLTIQTGDRVLLEGASGGGKSTLAAMLVGLRQPDSGLLLQRGIDRASLGELGWRAGTVAAPQFHENRVLLGTLAFNLLMGRSWPPGPGDLEEAEALCQELGLGPLLERMPAGMFQVVGESGWQLSHGERSRVFLARALLQDADLVVLDESFAALDPLNLGAALRCALARARTLVVIAHP